MSSVRAKFAVIVALCVLPLAIATFLISRALEREQREDDIQRLGAAERAFEAGLDADISRLQVAVRMLTTGSGLPAALRDGDRATPRRRIAHIVKVWPGLRVLIVSTAGEVLAASNEEEGSGSVGHAPPIRAALEGRAFEGVARLTVAHGAAPAKEPGPSYAVVEPVIADGEVLGAVLASFPFDQAWVEAAERRHGLDLSLRIGSTLVSRLESAGSGEPATTPGRGDLRRIGDRLLAVSTFAPARLKGAEPALVAASLDLSELERDHRRYL